VSWLAGWLAGSDGSWRLENGKWKRENEKVKKEK
jgi:hypothetical protein